MRACVRRVGPFVAGLLLVAGCGGGGEAEVDSAVSDAASAGQSMASAAESAGQSAASAAESAGQSAASAAESAAAGVKKVSANDASEAELVAALTAAGVENPDKWAKEVQEYRPYPIDDPGFTKLRGELAKYNPGPGVVDKIVSALEL